MNTVALTTKRVPGTVKRTTRDGGGNRGREADTTVLFCYFFEPLLFVLLLFRRLHVPTAGFCSAAATCYFFYCSQSGGGHGRQCESLCGVERSDLHWVEARFQIATGDDHLGAEMSGEQRKRRHCLVVG